MKNKENQVDDAEQNEFRIIQKFISQNHERYSKMKDDHDGKLKVNIVSDLIISKSR